MAPTDFTLYHNKFSICSIMVRYTFAIRGTPKDESCLIIIHEQDVDLPKQETLSEKYLTEINPKGQVPVLYSPTKTIPDSLGITFYLAEFYPSLIPVSHKDQIARGLKDLHALNYFSSTFAGRPYMAESIKAGIEKRLEGDISDRYREALKYKIEVNEKEKINGLKEGVPEEMKEWARSLMKTFESLLPVDGRWLLELSQPSALDAHLIVFIARMRDIGKDDIIPDSLAKYADVAMDTKEWKDVMRGRNTMASY